MTQRDAAIVVLFLDGPEWWPDSWVAMRVKELGLAGTKGKTFDKSVGMYLRERAEGDVDYRPGTKGKSGRQGRYRISDRPETKAWCERLIRNNPHYFRESYPQYFAPAESLPQPEARTRKGGKRRRVDPLLRCRVEKSAVEVTTAYYRQLGYRVDSQEKDNAGWDLLATRDGVQLRLEVKGLAGGEICVELTPNEYAQMRNGENRTMSAL